MLRANHGLAFLILSSLFFSGCIEGASNDPTGDAADTEDDREATLHPLPETITGFEHLGQLDTGGALGIWVEDDIAYLSGSSGLRIWDVEDPENPVLLAHEVADTQRSRDVQVFVHPANNRTYAVLGDNSRTMTFIDVSDPSDPTTAARVAVGGSTHNIAVVPDTAIVYNSRSLSRHTPEAGNTGQTDIVDFTDPDDPKVQILDFPAVATVAGGAARPVTATTCHDVTFNTELKRAYCAGVSQTLIMDYTDPLAPEILQVIDWPGTNIHHAAWDARDGNLLILGDEFAGVLAPTPMCHDTVPYPSSALWFFDITDLAAPHPVGYFQNEWDALGASMDAGDPIYCSTHFGTVIEDRDMLVVGWYSAGTALVDFSDTLNPVLVDHFRPQGGVHTWEARYHNGHIYTGDGARGMDILRLT